VAKLRQFRNDLDADLCEAVLAVFDKRGISQKIGITRILEWFVDQPSIIQQHMLRQLPEDIEADIAHLVLERMARSGGASSGGPQSTTARVAIISTKGGHSGGSRITGEPGGEL